MLVQIHMIQNHAPSNLNRDDTGSPKEALFGGVNRARISSQCLKRRIRQSEIFRKAMSGHLGVRTRRLPLEIEAILRSKDVADGCRLGDHPQGDDLRQRQGKRGQHHTPAHLPGLGRVVALADQLLDLYEADPKAFAKMKRDELEKQIKSVCCRAPSTSPCSGA